MKYRSQTSAAVLLERVKAAFLLETKPEDAFLYDVLNVFLSELYSGVIFDEHLAVLEKDSADIYVPRSRGDGDTAPFRIADIIDVYAGGYPYTRAPLSRLLQFPAAGERLYCTVGDDRLMLSGGIPLPAEITVSYRARPALIGESNAAAMLPLPEEFVPVVDAKLLGEAYRMAGENTLSANWLAEYNARFDSFRLWLRLGGAR